VGGFPDYSEWLESVWGWPDESGGMLPTLAGASNVVYGTNPPYTVQDFLALYPKFAGPPLISPVTTVSGSASVSVPDATGLTIGNAVAGPGIPNGTFISGIAGLVLTLSQNATASASISLTIWNAPPIPFAVITAYLYLATASLVQARWQEQWVLAVALYVAHFLTLYARSDGDPNSSVGRIAAQGLATGIAVAKSVGDVSVSYQPVQGLENWASWNLTQYGQMLATMAKVIGSGPMLAW